jgi:hypothetical protein
VCQGVRLCFAIFFPVGIGDLAPVTTCGRLVSVLSAVFGIITLASLFASLNLFFTLASFEWKMVELIDSFSVRSRVYESAATVIACAWRLHKARVCLHATRLSVLVVFYRLICDCFPFSPNRSIDPLACAGGRVSLCCAVLCARACAESHVPCSSMHQARRIRQSEFHTFMRRQNLMEAIFAFFNARLTVRRSSCGPALSLDATHICLATSIFTRFDARTPTALAVASFFCSRVGPISPAHFLPQQRNLTTRYPAAQFTRYLLSDICDKVAACADHKLGCEREVEYVANPIVSQMLILFSRRKRDTVQVPGLMDKHGRPVEMVLRQARSVHSRKEATLRRLRELAADNKTYSSTGHGSNSASRSRTSRSNSLTASENNSYMGSPLLGARRPSWVWNERMPTNGGNPTSPLLASHQIAGGSVTIATIPEERKEDALGWSRSSTLMSKQSTPSQRSHSPPSVHEASSQALADVDASLSRTSSRVTAVSPDSGSETTLAAILCAGSSLAQDGGPPNAHPLSPVRPTLPRLQSLPLPSILEAQTVTLAVPPSSFSSSCEPQLAVTVYPPLPPSTHKPPRPPRRASSYNALLLRPPQLSLLDEDIMLPPPASSSSSTTHGTASINTRTPPLSSPLSSGTTTLQLPAIPPLPFPTHASIKRPPPLPAAAPVHVPAPAPAPPLEGDSRMHVPLLPNPRAIAVRPPPLPVHDPVHLQLPKLPNPRTVFARPPPLPSLARVAHVDCTASAMRDSVLRQFQALLHDMVILSANIGLLVRRMDDLEAQAFERGA